MTLLAKLWLWLISIVLSVVLFLSVQIAQEETDHDYDFSVKIVNLPGRLIVTEFNGQPTNGEDLKLTLKVTGPQNLLDELKNRNLDAQIDCHDQGPGRPALPVVVQKPGLHFAALKFEKKKVALRLEPVLTVAKKVEVDPTGDFNLRNYVYDSSTVEPESVEFHGPRSQVNKVTRARVALNLSEITKSQTVHLKVELLDANGAAVDGITPLTSYVDVHPTVVPAPQNKMLLVQPTWSGDAPAPGYEAWGTHVTPSQVSVVGDSEELARTTTIDTMPINLGGLTSTTNVRVKLKVPRGIKVQGSATVTVRVNIRQSPASQSVPKPTAPKPVGADAQNPLP